MKTLMKFARSEQPSAPPTVREVLSSLLEATNQSLMLLDLARRLAFSPSQASWRSCIQVGETAARMLSGPLNGVAQPDGEAEGGSFLSQRAQLPPVLAHHTYLAARVGAVVLAAFDSDGDAPSAIRFGERIADLQLEVARHRTRLQSALVDFGHGPSLAPLAGRLGSAADRARLDWGCTPS
jgi:hypothetical protein